MVDLLEMVFVHHAMQDFMVLFVMKVVLYVKMDNVLLLSVEDVPVTQLNLLVKTVVRDVLILLAFLPVLAIKLADYPLVVVKTIIHQTRQLQLVIQQIQSYSLEIKQFPQELPLSLQL